MNLCSANNRFDKDAVDRCVVLMLHSVHDYSCYRWVQQAKKLCLKKFILCEIMGIEKIHALTGLNIAGENYLEAYKYGYKYRSAVRFVV